MEKRIIFLFAATALLLLLFAEQSLAARSFSSMQFTRESLMHFSRGSERTVDILTPKKTTKTIMKAVTDTKKVSFKTHSFHKSVKSVSGRPWPGIKPMPTAYPKPPPKKLVPVTETVVTYQNKRKVYHRRSSPSNKFLEAINDIERAVANAKASSIRYSNRTLTKLKAIVERAIQSKSYKYARQILGQIMFLLSTKPVSPGRGKRSSQNEGSAFLQGLRERVGSATFDSFMAVQGDVSLMFVIDDTGSMSEEIEATKNIAIDIINYQRNAPIVSYILSPFNDPYLGESLVIAKEESEAGEFVKEINKLKAHEGGDCPENTFRGMLEALYQEPAWGSPMYVFTDAGPKDATELNIQEVMCLAGDEFGVTINFFTTGHCGSGSDPTQLHPTFRELAEFTSGQALLLKNEWELQQLKGLTDGVLEGDNVVSFGSNMSNRKKRMVLSRPTDDGPIVPKEERHWERDKGDFKRPIGREEKEREWERDIGDLKHHFKRPIGREEEEDEDEEDEDEDEDEVEDEDEDEDKDEDEDEDEERHWERDGAVADSQYSIPIDDSIEEMTVSVTTTRRDTGGRGITLRDPDNVVITSGKLSLSQISVYELKNPKRGTWTLTVLDSNGGHKFFVKSSSATNVDFEHYFLTVVSRHRGQPVEVPISNPILGKLNKMVITLAGSEKVNTRSLRLQLVTTEGTHISDVILVSRDSIHFTADITPLAPAQSFKLKLKGTTRNGNPFERISRQTIKPTTVVLRVKRASNDHTLPIGKTTFIHFQLCNFGESTESFDIVVIKDRLRYVTTSSVSSRRVNKDRCSLFPVRAKATRSQDVGKTDSVFIVAKGMNSSILVSQTVRLFVVS